VQTVVGKERNESELPSYDLYSGKSQNVIENDSDYFPFMEICEYGQNDYKNLKTKFEKHYPIGINATNFISTVKKYFDVDVANYPVLDIKYYKKREKREPNSYFWSLEKSCKKDRGGRDIWRILLLADMSNNVTAFEFKLVVDDERYADRGAPFNFDYFDKKAAEKALRSLIGLGTEKSTVLEIFKKFEAGDYGTFDMVPTYHDDGRTLIYWYHVNTESISTRTSAYKFTWRIFLRFDGNNRLIYLTVK